MFALKFRSRLWMYKGPGGWHFITLPKKLAGEVRRATAGRRRGWGSVRVNATIGTTSWKTSVFPDSKSASYVLPVKSNVRSTEGLVEGDMVAVLLEIHG